MKQTVVLYPGAGVGHFGSMTELAHVFLNHGYDITTVLIEPPVKSSDSGAAAIERIAAANPSISFHVLPLRPVPDIAASGKHPFIFLNHGYDVTMVLIEPPVKSSDSGAAAIERIAAANPSISFHVLPLLPVPDIAASGKHPFIHLLQLLRDYNELLEAFLRSIPRERL